MLLDGRASAVMHLLVLPRTADVTLGVQPEKGAAAAQMEETVDRLENQGRPIMEDVAYRRVKV